MPLQVEYREQYAAAGRFPGGFTKREGKASDNEILTCRLVDRALRPLFPADFHAEVFVNVILFSADGVDQPDALAGFAASCALACSDIPFECPISEVRVARVNGEYVVDPTFEQMKDADMDIMVGASKDNIMMVEGEMNEVSEQDLLQALKVAQEAIRPMCVLQEELMKELGTDVKREYCHEVNDEELREQLRKETYDKCYAIAQAGDHDKKAREEAFDKIKTDFEEAYAAAHADLTEDELEEKYALVDRYYHDVERDAMRRCILDEGKRLDGRKTDEIRPIWCEVSPLPMPHGSSIFTRGETQSLTTCTLGTKLDEKLVDDVLDSRPLIPAFPAALQLPALLYGRSQGAARRRPPRNRPRTPGLARAERTDTRGVPLHGAPRFTDTGEQRLVVNGYRLRRNSRPHGRRSAHEEARERHRHGSYQEPGRRQVRRA